MKSRIFFLFSFCFFVYGCSQSVSPENPDWVEKLVQKFMNEPVGNPPQSIWRYEYKGETVYYVPAQCCDQFSTLYDANGKIVGAPDGGIGGHGDGKTSDFFVLRINEKLIWKDSRTR